jgi:hypothetical protein
MAAPANSAPEVVYAPGACNLGGDEVEYRKKVGYIGTAIAIALAALLFLVSAAPWVFIVVAAPVFMAAIGFVQAKESFCVRYASEGIYNVGDGLGNHQQVSSDIDRAADKAKARTLNLRALGIALGVAVVLGAISAVVS